MAMSALRKVQVGVEVLALLRFPRQSCACSCATIGAMVFLLLEFGIFMVRYTCICVECPKVYKREKPRRVVCLLPSVNAIHTICVPNEIVIECNDVHPLYLKPFTKSIQHSRVCRYHRNYQLKALLVVRELRSRGNCDLLDEQ